MRFPIVAMVLLLGAWSNQAWSQEQAKPGFDRAAGTVSAQLQESLAELAALRQQIADKAIPLNRQLNERESELLAARSEFQQVSRVLDGRTLDLTNLRTEIKAREEEYSYLANLFNEYVRNFESRLHIAELQRFNRPLSEAKLANENSNLTREQVFKIQTDLIALSLERVEQALGGVRYEGNAVSPNGQVINGQFLMVGPVVLFHDASSGVTGTAEQRLGSMEPNVVVFAEPPLTQAATQVVTGQGTQLLLDPTLGNAHVIEQVKETLWEHILKGGPVMLPIFVLAGAALLVALWKWLTLSLVRRPTSKRIKALLAAVAARDKVKAMAAAKAVGGPAGRMLAVGVEHLHEPRELIEEVMFERLLTERLKLQRMLPFIAISASAAPLLGLLGTVTGIMNTFKLITVFGSGDIKMLSSGISEALITTEWGLYVAIPSLLIHALLSRKAKALIDQTEQCAISFLNQIALTQPAEKTRNAGGSNGEPHPRKEPPAMEVVVVQPVPTPRKKATDSHDDPRPEAVPTA